ncbi:LysE family translocator [Dermatophilaceae bacterium Sec6.4]
MEAALLTFSAVAFLLVVTPGPDFAAVVPNALRGRPAGIATALGTASGLAVHAGIAAAGLSTIVLASDCAFSLVKYLGAAFLVLLGLRALWRSRGSKTAEEPRTTVPSRPLPIGRAYRQGLMVNVLNPKAPLIYLSVMPQFLQTNVSTTAQLLAMSAILVAIALTWYTTLTFLVAVFRPVIERFRASIDRFTGLILITLGIRVAFETRPA